MGKFAAQCGMNQSRSKTNNLVVTELALLAQYRAHQAADRRADIIIKVHFTDRSNDSDTIVLAESCRGKTWIDCRQAPIIVKSTSRYFPRRVWVGRCLKRKRRLVSNVQLDLDELFLGDLDTKTVNNVQLLVNHHLNFDTARPLAMRSFWGAGPSSSRVTFA
ncbi:hypothetical protein BT63DRAFT_417368 [Microthyrium microscopicum]|uniref:Uncharacterized protein n=1 Tax=Microthyrium microscopicum TaxID=703497 RepID=A0A6A6U0M2_9PEZI|nr:hypothetical protein BT63DRAFT_417368 [Microthyrium microscopicum]